MQKQDELGVRFGKYHVFAKLAVGGMAELFLAKQPGIGGFSKTVVLKCILPHLAQEEDFVTMFLDEARVVAPLDHPNIVQIYDIGEHAGVYFIAMEYIRGQTLKEFRKKLYQQNPEVKPYRLSAGIIAQAASGLHHAHNARDDDGTPLQLVHRDVSPTNLLISYNGVVKIVDFGVAKATTQQHKTSAGTIKGKYRYMSPEQIRGLPLDGRSDVFSLGIVLYELSTNAALFGRRHEAEIIEAVRNARVPPPSKFRPDYPEALEAIVMKALEKDREKRYQSADELRCALEQYMREEGAHYGTTQLAELMQYLFSKEQSQERTGMTHRPLSPADFVRFLGEFPSPEAMSPYTGSFPKPADTEDSYSGPKRSTGSTSWPRSGSGAEHISGTPSSGPQAAASDSTPRAQHTPLPSGTPPAAPGSPPPASEPPSQTPGTPPPASPSPFADGQKPTPQIPHAEPLELPEETRTELSPVALSSEHLDAFGVDLSPMESVIIEDTNPAHTPALDAPKKRHNWLLGLLLLLLLGGGAYGGYVYYYLPQQQGPSFAELQNKIEAQLKAHHYIQASELLRKAATLSLSPKQRTWLKRTQQHIAISPQLDLASKLLKKKQWQASLQLLIPLQAQAPDDPRLLALLKKAKAGRLAAQRAAPARVEPRRVIPPIPRRTAPIRRRPVKRRRRRRWRRRQRRRPPRRRVRVARAVVPRPPQHGRLEVRSQPKSRVYINGAPMGWTPLRDKRLKPGSYQLELRASRYRPLRQNIQIRSGQTTRLSLRLTQLPEVRRRAAPPRKVLPQRTVPSGPRARYPFSAVRLPRKQQLRIYISDPRGLAGRHSTLRLRKLARQIEREVGRLLGSDFRVSGITRAWQRTVRRIATQRNSDYYTFYPRAVAYVIYRDLLRGRSYQRVAQVLVKYEYRQRFRRIRK